jgi:hypothetical protein
MGKASWMLLRTVTASSTEKKEGRIKFFIVIYLPLMPLLVTVTTVIVNGYSQEVCSFAMNAIIENCCLEKFTRILTV